MIYKLNVMKSLIRQTVVTNSNEKEETYKIIHFTHVFISNQLFIKNRYHLSLIHKISVKTTRHIVVVALLTL